MTNAEKALRISKLLGTFEDTTLQTLDESFVPKIEKAESIEEIHKIRSIVSPANAVVQRRAIEKWSALSVLEIQKAETIEEVISALDRAPKNDDEIEKLAREKWDSLSMLGLKNAKNAKDAQNVYHRCRTRSDAQEAALKGWVRLSLNEISASKTPAELSSAFGDSPKTISDVQKNAILKAGELID